MLSTNSRLFPQLTPSASSLPPSISTTPTSSCSCNNASNFGFQFSCNCNQGEISTIFIIGFPDDFKDRELSNMFIFAPGFEGAVLKTTTISNIFGVAAGVFDDPSQRKQQLIGFVKFSKASEAAYALDILNGRILDQERGIVLKAEIAKKNLYIKFASSSTTAAVPQRKSSATFGSMSDEESASSVGCSCEYPNSCHMCNRMSSKSPLYTANRFMSITLPGQSDPALITAPSDDVVVDETLNGIARPLPISKPLDASTSSSFSFSVSPASSGSPVLLLKSPLPTPERIIDLCAMQRNLINSPTLGSMAAIVGENFPCNTLYVGNLPPSAQEEELRALFRNCLGYRRLSFRPKASGPMCFVEFEDIACATAAMETLYGTMISCSIPAKGGIRLSFSKNPLGLRVASPSPIGIPLPSSGLAGSPNSPSFMEAIGAEAANPNHQQAIATVFSHYYQNNPHKSPEFISSFIKNLPVKSHQSS